METPGPVTGRDIVLVGGGYSHVQVLRAFGRRPVPGARLTLICRDTLTPYGPMLPGYITGAYDDDAAHIDLSCLAEFAGARLYRAEAVGLDRSNRRVLCRDRPPVRYDLLSINVGSTPRMYQLPRVHEPLLAPRPSFHQRWQALLERVRRHAEPLRIAVIGGSLRAVELALAMRARLDRELRGMHRDPAGVGLHLLSEQAEVLATHPRTVRRRLARLLAERGIQLHTDARVRDIRGRRLTTELGRTLEVDEIVWAVRSEGPSWLRDSGLELDERRFVLVDETLQSLTDPRILAAGDVASLRSRAHPHSAQPPSGIGATLALNLHRLARGLQPYPLRSRRPRLRLLGTADGRALAVIGPVVLAGAWVARWKHRLERRRVASYCRLQRADDPTVGAPQPSGAVAHLDMPQLDMVTLKTVSQQLKPVRRNDIAAGLMDDDDMAVLRPPQGKLQLQETRFLSAFISDPYLFGRLAANHALGGIHASGAQPQCASPLALLPAGSREQCAELLLQMLQGALDVLNEANCSLLRGHVGSAGTLGLGFTVSAVADPSARATLRRQGLRAGNMLILTKPLGVGTLLAAHARLRCRARWLEAALSSIGQSTRLAAQCLRDFGATACADVGETGLLGQLLAMTEPFGVGAELRLDALPLLDGALVTAAEGLFHSAHHSNLLHEGKLTNRAQAVLHPRYPLLFDPQIAGGLLAGLPAERAQPCLQALRALGYRQAAIIGQVRRASHRLRAVALEC